MNAIELPIEKAIKEFLEVNPSFEPPKVSQHPSVLALTNEMQPALIEKFGGLVPYWENMLIGMKKWFTPNEDSLEYKNFRSRLFCACGLAQHSDLKCELNEIYESYKIWEKMH